MNEMKLSGVTHASGGTYENVKVEGVASINGDMNCEVMRIQGVSTFNGNIHCTELDVGGTCKVKGSVRGGKCRLTGLLTVDGDLEADVFTGSGSFQVGGSINAEEVDIKYVYGSGAEEVCGEKIKIWKETTSGAVEFIMDLIPWRHKGRKFQCRLVEGDTINIENVAADVVRGTSVIIGPECEIELVEYHESLEVYPGAVVRKTVKLGE